MLDWLLNSFRTDDKVWMVVLSIVTFGFSVLTSTWLAKRQRLEEREHQREQRHGARREEKIKEYFPDFAKLLNILDKSEFPPAERIDDFAPDVRISSVALEQAASRLRSASEFLDTTAFNIAVNPLSFSLMMNTHAVRAAVTGVAYYLELHAKAPNVGNPEDYEAVRHKFNEQLLFATAAVGGFQRQIEVELDKQF